SEPGRNQWSGGPIADRYAVNREGSYDAFLGTRGDSAVSVHIDPAMLPAEPTAPHLQLLRAPERTRQFALVVEDHERRRAEHRAQSARLEAEGKLSYEIEDDWSEDLRELARERRRTKDPFLRQAWTMSYLWAGTAHQYQHPW